jgi:hypothetical protein
MTHDRLIHPSLLQNPSLALFADLPFLKLFPKMIGSRFMVQGSKVIIYFTRVQG